MELTPSRISKSLRTSLLALSKVTFSIIGYPKPDEPLQSTIEALGRFEYSAKYFRSYKHGFKQSSFYHFEQTDPPIDYISLAIRITAIGNIIRGLILVSTDEPLYRLILGDPLYGTNVLPFAPLFIAVWLVNIYIIFEWFHWLERSGSLSMLHDYHSFRLDQFKALRQELTESKFEVFRILIHLFSNFFSRFHICGIFLMTLLVNSPLLSNPVFYHDYIFMITGTLWSISLTFAMSYLFNCTASIGGHFVFVSTLVLIRFKSLVERCSIATTKETVLERLASLPHFDDKDYHLITRTIDLCNKTDALSQSLKYILLHYIMLISMIGDLGLFFGTIAPTESKLIQYILSSIGYLILLILGAALYATADVIQDLIKLHRSFHQILRTKQFETCQQILKVHGIFDRIIGPYNGIKAGDLSVITKRFFINTLLENASAIMLFTCNVSTYMWKN